MKTKVKFQAESRPSRRSRSGSGSWTLQSGRVVTGGGSNSAGRRRPVGYLAGAPGFLCGPGVPVGGLTRQAYSITETAPLFRRHRKNKRRALMRVQEAHLPDSPGPDPPWAYAASGSAAVPSLRLQPSISLCLITFVLALRRTDYSFS